MYFNKKNISYIEQKEYGFHLCPYPYVKDYAGEEYEKEYFLLNDQKYEISQNKYLSISANGKKYYYATHHNAAHFFTINEYSANYLTGNEPFLHIDQQGHPDNSRSPLLTEDFLNQEKHISLLKNGHITICNYVTALSELFPQMTYYFMFKYLKPNYVTWKGMTFKSSCSINSYDLYNVNNNILSIDLDIFDAMENPEPIFRTIVEIASYSKLIMFFSSPGFNDWYRSKFALKYFNEILGIKTGELKN